jgi:hypothetical protein
MIFFSSHLSLCFPSTSSLMFSSMLVVFSVLVMFLVFTTLDIHHALGVCNFWSCCAHGFHRAIGVITLVVLVVLLVLLCSWCSWCS